MTKPRPKQEDALPPKQKSSDQSPSQPEQDGGLILNGAFKEFGGSRSDAWNRNIVSQTTAAVWVGKSDESDREQLAAATLAGLMGIKPVDELEGMMAAQLLAAHNAALECYRRAMISGQTLEVRNENLNQANKLSRTWAVLLDGLNRHRGKGQQKVTVEHVHVHSGGQAVVGIVERPGVGDQDKVEEQPHAKAKIISADVAQPPLRSPDPDGHLVRVPRDG